MFLLFQTWAAAPCLSPGSCGVGGGLASRGSRQAPAMQRMRRLKSGTVVESPVTGNRFLVANRLGEGGYGCAYRVQRLDSWDRRIKDYCSQDYHGPGKLAPRGLFWRTTEWMRTCDSHVRFLYRCFRRPGGTECCTAWSLSMRSMGRSETIWPRPSRVGRQSVPVERSSRF